MKIQVILLLVVISNLSFGQKVFRSNREEYKANKFSYEFYLYDDSICFLKGHYFDNSDFYLYKGTLRKTNDTLFEFNYQPIVEFGCDEGLHAGNELRFSVAQVDTVISSLDFKIKTADGIWGTVAVQLGDKDIEVMGSEKHDFTIDTKFVDPLTHKKIFFNVGTSSDPSFTYYGSKTKINNTQISIIKNRLTIYPDRKHINKKESFVLIK